MTSGTAAADNTVSSSSHAAGGHPLSISHVPLRTPPASPRHHIAGVSVSSKAKTLIASVVRRDENESSILVKSASSSSSRPDDPLFPRPPKRMLYMLTVCASFGAALLGYDVGVMSGAILFIEEDFVLSTFQTEVIISSLNIVSLFGALIAGKIADSFGRRRTTTLAAIIFGIASIVMSFSNGFWTMLAGRVLAGIGVGMALVVPPLYIAEISPPRFRGGLVTVSEIAQNVGILLGYIFSFVLAGLPQNLNWRVMLAIGAIASVIMLMTVAVMPESPRWLVQQGRLDDASESLMRTHYADEIKDALIEIDMNIQREKSASGSKGWGELLRPAPAVRLMLIVGVGAAFFQQASGAEAAVYYTPKILEEAGIEGNKNTIAGAIAVGSFKTTALIISAMSIDKVGRRPMMVMSTCIATIALSLLGIGFVFESHPSVAVAGMCLYMVGFGIGLGPIGWLMIAEVFPIHLRGRAMAIGTAVNRLVSGIVALTFLSLSRSISQAGAFFFYSGISAVAIAFAVVYIPETTNKSLEEVVQDFHLASQSGKLDLIRRRKRKAQS